MRNGTTGRDHRRSPLTRRSPERDEIDIATIGGTITCSRGTFDRTDGGIDLAYAVTSYAVQGATNDVSTSAIIPHRLAAASCTSTSPVAATSNQLFGTRPVTDDTDTEQPPSPPREPNSTPVLRTRLREVRLGPHSDSTRAPDTLPP